MTVDSLFEQLKHPNPHLRERAMFELAENRDENTIPRLMSVLNDEDVTLRRAAVKTLGVIGVDSVPSVVESLLNSNNVTVRGSCAKALAQIAVNYPDIPFPTEGLQGLQTAINDSNPVVHIAAVMALGEVGSPAFDILVEALKTTDNVAVAVSVVNALAASKDERAIEVLKGLTNDESADSYVQESAVSALSRLEQVLNLNARRQQ
jgi:bilin biosynthesis protein